MKIPKVVSIILNTNRREDTLACLDSLFKSTYANNHVIVLDNHSTDGSVEAIQAQYPDAQIVAIEENQGYAGNNNVGIKLAQNQGADWVFVLNEDTVLDQECLARLVEVGHSDDQIGIIGPMVYHFDEPDYIQTGGGMFGRYWESIHLAKDELDHGQLESPHVVDWISGCAIMLRKAVIDDVGMLDSRFFYYWEETEWCLRAGRAGWKVMHVPEAKLWHKGVQRNYTPKPSLMYYNTRNHLLMIKKHRAPVRVWIYTSFQTLRTLVSWTIRPKWRKKRPYRDAMWYGLIDFLRGRWGQREV